MEIINGSRLVNPKDYVDKSVDNPPFPTPLGNINVQTATASLSMTSPVFIGDLDGTAAYVDVLDSTDSTCYVALFESATGSLAPRTDGNLTYDASTGALTIGGDLIVNGTTTTIDTVNLTVEDNLITINNGQIGIPDPSLISGLEIERGNETNYQFMFRELDDSFVIGEIGTLQCVSTREDTPTSGGVPFWNSTDIRFDTDAELTYIPGTNTLTVTNISTNGRFVQTFSDDTILPASSITLTGSRTASTAQSYGLVITDSTTSSSTSGGTQSVPLQIISNGNWSDTSPVQKIGISSVVTGLASKNIGVNAYANGGTLDYGVYSFGIHYSFYGVVGTLYNAGSSDLANDVTLGASNANSITLNGTISASPGIRIFDSNSTDYRYTISPGNISSNTAITLPNTSGKYLALTDNADGSVTGGTFTSLGIKYELFLSYSTTDTIAYSTGKLEVSGTLVEKTASTISTSTQSNGTWKFVCIDNAGTITLETATGNGTVRPSDTCFTYANYISTGKYGYYFDTNKRIMGAVYKVSTTSFYMINLGNESEEWGENSLGFWRIDKYNIMEQWGINAYSTPSCNGVAGSIFITTELAGPTYPITFSSVKSYNANIRVPISIAGYMSTSAPGDTSSKGDDFYVWKYSAYNSTFTFNLDWNAKGIRG